MPVSRLGLSRNTGVRGATWLDPRSRVDLALVRALAGRCGRAF